MSDPSLQLHSALSNYEEFKRKREEHKKVNVYLFPGRHIDKFTCIANMVCNYYETSYIDVLAKNRRADIVWVRHLIMYFCRKYITHLSLMEIGKKIGGRDHATVLHAIKHVNNIIDTDKKRKAEVNTIKTAIIDVITIE